MKLNSALQPAESLRYWEPPPLGLLAQPNARRSTCHFQVDPHNSLREHFTALPWYWCRRRKLLRFCAV